MKSFIALVVLSFLLIYGAISYKLEDIIQHIPNAKEEIDREILTDFLEQLKKQTTVDYKQLAKRYQEFKQNWINKMIQYLIQQLQIGQEDAKEARKNPHDFHINYSTYKLFASFK